MLQKVSDIRQHFIDELNAERFVTDKTGVKTIELVGANFVADEPLIFGAVNEDYVEREQSLSMSRIFLARLLPSGKQSLIRMVRSILTTAGASGQMTIMVSTGKCITSSLTIVTVVVLL